MQITNSIFKLLQTCRYPFRTVLVNDVGVLEHYPTMEDVLSWLRKENVFISALPFRDAEEGSKLYFYYSVIDLNDFNDNDDILCNESHLGVSDVDYESYEDALYAGVETYLKIMAREVKVNSALLLGGLMG